MFQIVIDTNGDAFRDGFGDLDIFGTEVCRIVRDSVLFELEYGTATSGALFDINGNKVGSWVYKDES